MTNLFWAQPNYGYESQIVYHDMTDFGKLTGSNCIDAYLGLVFAGNGMAWNFPKLHLLETKLYVR